MNHPAQRTRRPLKPILFLMIYILGCQGSNGVDPLPEEKGTVFYVSTEGNDQWSGTLPTVNTLGNDGPFASLQHARDAVRKMRSEEINTKFTIFVRGGVYRLNETFTLGPEDSGTASYPFTIRAYEKERPILSGSRPVTGFTKYINNIYKADLKGTYLESYGIRQLFAEGKRQILARFPNYDSYDPIGGGFLYVDNSVEGGSKVKFIYQENTIPVWPNLNNSEVVIYSGPNYGNNIIPIAAIDYGRRIIQLGDNTFYPITTGNRYFFQNILEELDSPGEWYFDFLGKSIYLWPLNLKSLDNVSVPVLKSIVEIKRKTFGVPAHIRFEGFTLEDCEGSAIIVKDANDIFIAGCTIFNAGGIGIEINGGSVNAALGNDIYEVGGAGITISGGDRKTLSPGANRAENNYIHSVGVISKFRNGIECSGVGNIVSHNLIHSTPRMGISFDGNDHIIEYNHVHHVNQETEDSGIIYACTRDWTKRGNVVRFNYVHDSGGYGRNNATEPWKSPINTSGIYLDGYTSGTEVYGNIVANTYHTGIFIHGGRDNYIMNNIIVEGGRSQMMYAAILPDNNLILEMFNKVAEMGYTKYPLLSTIIDAQQGSSMSGNKFTRNIVYYTSNTSWLYAINGNIDSTTTESDYNTIYSAGAIPLIPFTQAPFSQHWKVWNDQGMDLNSVVADPLFYDFIKGDFRLSPNSPAFNKGFIAIPLDKIGLYVDPYRPSWPVN